MKASSDADTSMNKNEIVVMIWPFIVQDFVQKRPLIHYAATSKVTSNILCIWLSQMLQRKVPAVIPPPFTLLHE